MCGNLNHYNYATKIKVQEIQKINQKILDFIVKQVTGKDIKIQIHAVRKISLLSI